LCHGAQRRERVGVVECADGQVYLPDRLYHSRNLDTEPVNPPRHHTRRWLLTLDRLLVVLLVNEPVQQLGYVLLPGGGSV